jgi:hypothetical protein
VINSIADLMPADHRRWLASKAPSAVVGIAGDCTACVVAQWLSETLCIRVVATYSACWLYSESGRHYCDNPAWLRDYVGEIDELDEYRITAAAALEILGRVERMEALT